MTGFGRAFSSIFFLAFAVLAMAASAVAQDRVALVIGNSNYLSVDRLENPANDAADIGSSLSRIGFDVAVETDLDAASMSRVLAEFARRARGAEQAILYFAGHGVEIDKRNYLIPTDAKIRDTLDVTYQSIELEKLLRTVEGAEKLRLVMLDACRDNPFPFTLAGATRSLSRGLARIEPKGGVLVSYAARGGTVAYDGEGRNSPYAAALLKHIERPGLEIGKLFRQVRDDVYQATGGLQEPFTYGSLPAEDIFLAGFAGPGIVDAFAAAQTANTPEAWELFLKNYGDDAGQQGLINAARQLAALARGEPAMRAPDPEPEIAAPTDPKELEAFMQLSLAGRKKVQTMLADVGFPSGPADGVFGRRSRQSIKDFQTAFNLDPTGFVSPAMLRVLDQEWSSAPATLDGLWQVTVLREARNRNPANGYDFVGRRDIIAVLQVQITGRNVELLDFKDATSRPSALQPALRATLSRVGTLDLSLVVNYEHFRNRASRVVISTDLPARTSYGRLLESRKSQINAQLLAVGSLRRLNQSEDGFTWDPAQ